VRRNLAAARTATHYFKAGVYGPASARAETRFRNIKYWVKP
jgi:hypothetical protein